jgi:thioredoxin 1
MIEITEQDFEKEVLECDIPVLTCFTTEWCQSCYGTCLFTDQLVAEYDGIVKFVRMDMEKSPKIAERYHVIAVPTMFLFQEAQLVKKLFGFQDRSSVRSLLSSATEENNVTTRKLNLTCEVLIDYCTDCGYGSREEDVA